MTEGALRRALFFGSLMESRECEATPGCPASAARYQEQLLGSLIDGAHCAVRAICPAPVPSYPEWPDLFVARTERMLANGVSLVSPGFLNRGALRVLTQVPAVFWEALRDRARSGRSDVVLIYNLHPGYALPAWIVARVLRRPIVGVVADVFFAGSEPPKGLLRRIEARFGRALLGDLDGVLAFSSLVLSDFGVRAPSLRAVPAMDASEALTGSPVKSSECRRVALFSGTLVEANGVDLLLEGFRRRRVRDTELWIVGRGPMEDEIRRLPPEEGVRFKGFLRREELLDLQRRSLLLVNPRPNTLREHRYNFPSKVIEYMASGRPVVTTGSADIRAEYWPYVLGIEREDPEGVAEALDRGFTMGGEALDALGARARLKVLEEKTWAAEGQRVAKFLRSITLSW
jgi:glycosyltransferase involved in cell wall biosynthesis